MNKTYIFYFILMVLFYRCQKPFDSEKLYRNYLNNKLEVAKSEWKSTHGKIRMRVHDEPNKYHLQFSHMKKLDSIFDHYQSQIKNTTEQKLQLEIYQKLTSSLNLQNKLICKNQEFNLLPKIAPLPKLAPNNGYIPHHVKLNFYAFFTQTCETMYSIPFNHTNDTIYLSHKIINDSIIRVYLHSKEIHDNLSYFSYEYLFKIDSVILNDLPVSVSNKQLDFGSFSFSIPKEYNTRNIKFQGSFYKKTSDSTFEKQSFINYLN